MKIRMCRLRKGEWFKMLGLYYQVKRFTKGRMYYTPYGSTNFEQNYCGRRCMWLVELVDKPASISEKLVQKEKQYKNAS